MKHEPLLGDLRRAFPPVPIDATKAFADRGRLYCDAVEYQNRLHGKTWEQLDAQFFARRSDGLSFLGTPYIVAVLPHYLHLLLVLVPTSPVPETLLPMLTRPRFEETRTPHILTREVFFELLKQHFEELILAVTDAQSAVIAAALRRFIELAPNEGEPAQRALDRHWGTFAQSSQP